jgi:ABC-type glycerol-3-phosphate transport system substrate-binding protein
MSGAKPPEVELILSTASFPRQEMEVLLAEFCDCRKLYLNIKLRDISEHNEQVACISSKRAIISQVKFFDNPLFGSILDYSAFPDYQAVYEQMKTLPVLNRNIFLPFSLFPIQMAVNRRIFKRIGFSMEHLNQDFSWWDDYVRICHRHDIHPAAKYWPFHSLWCFEKYLPLFFSLRCQETKDPKSIYNIPLFDSDSGKRFLQIVKSYSTFRTSKDNAICFEKGQAGISFNIGSWIAVQHEKRFGLPAKDFCIIPHIFGNRKICNIELSGLMTFVSPDLTPDEKQHIWEFLKILVSREFQIRLAGISGMVSVRKDIAPNAYPWNCREDYKAFFSDSKDVLIYNNVFNMRVIAALSTLYEQFEAYGADPGHILKDMDEKVRSIHEAS